MKLKIFFIVIVIHPGSCNCIHAEADPDLLDVLFIPLLW